MKPGPQQREAREDRSQSSARTTESHMPKLPPGTMNGRCTSGNFLRSVITAGRLNR